MVSNADGTSSPLTNHTTILTIAYHDPSVEVAASASPSSSPAHLLSFCIRSSFPDVVKVKGGWGQLLGPGESTTVQLSLRKGAGKLFQDHVDLRLWIAYELLPFGAHTDESDDEVEALRRKWKEQRRLRSKGELLSSRSEASSASGGGALWKGRNFDLLNSSSIVVPCRMSTVRSELTAELDILHDQVRLKRAQLGELQAECDALVEQGSLVVSQIKQGPKRRTSMSASMSSSTASRSGIASTAEQTPVISISETKQQKFVRFLGEVEWMEVVGMLLVMSSTALLVISL